MFANGERRGHAASRFELDLMALPVIERERVAFVAVAARDAQAGGGIESSAEQTDRFQNNLPPCMRGSFIASNEPMIGNKISALIVVCMLSRSDSHPIRGMNISPAVPHANPIISALTVP